MKTCELSGGYLNFWVLKSLGEPARLMGVGDSYQWAETRQKWLPLAEWVTWSSSHDWMAAGPIIEQEKIQIAPCDKGWSAWMPFLSPRRNKVYTGDTPLIATMRCYVASKFGDEVPDLQPAK